MRFVFQKDKWKTIEQAERECFLLTNGLGGYCSLTAAGAAARGDHALLMAARKAPNVRWHLVTNVLEQALIDGETHTLTTQRMKAGGDYAGYTCLREFVYDDFDAGAPSWTFQADGVTIRKTVLMVHGENTVALKYTVLNPQGRDVRLELTPLIRFSPKKESFDAARRPALEPYAQEEAYSCYKMIRDGYSLYLAADARIEPMAETLFGEMYFSQDVRDGREAYGNALMNCRILYDLGHGNDGAVTVIFSDRPYACHAGIYDRLAESEAGRKRELAHRAGLRTALGKQLAVSADAYVVERASTNGKSMIAGYPYFEDWGRDTMIALAGVTLVTRRFETCKSILRTFARYEKGGLLPNLFPEGDATPMYNSADAPLLFINAAFEYMEYAGDYDFKEELLPVFEDIIAHYKKGADFHIRMDDDGLICAGDGYEQLTWMDVRVGDFLPTPRHGKPVEINAYWYSALRIMERLTGGRSYAELAQRVRDSFLEKFWNEKEQCLKDVLSGNKEENQIRCNQIWALSTPFTMLPPEKERLVIQKVKDELYTEIGLRTLSKWDPDFHAVYIGPMEKRDRAYHQGTVWAFPLGAYYRACLRYAGKCEDTAERDALLKEVKEGLERLEPWLAEGCVAQVAEIYDGGAPTVSRGCFAQAWSVGELLRAVYDYERFGKSGLL